MLWRKLNVLNVESGAKDSDGNEAGQVRRY